jgi:non-ribosomal peptide synthetase component F
MYHIISDGVSIQIFLEEFMALYHNQALPLINIQYKDFSHWQSKRVERGELEKQKEYWLKQFKDYTPLPKIPTDYPRPAIRNFGKGDLVCVELESRENLHDALEKTGTTLYMFLVAVYNILLSKYTGHEEITVGTPAFGRPHEELQDVIGVFLNMLSMKNYPQKEKTFAAFLHEVKKNALDAYENQDYPYDELVSQLNLQGDIGRNPIFDTEFAIGNVDIPEVNIPGLTLKPFSKGRMFAKFDLYFLVMETKENISMVVRYSTDLFKKSTVEKLIDGYIEILQQVLEKRATRIKDIFTRCDLSKAKSNIDQDNKSDFDF